MKRRLRWGKRDEAQMDRDVAGYQKCFRDGYAAAKSQAIEIARLYEKELRRMAVDAWMLSPFRAGDFSEEALWKEVELSEEGWRKGEAAHAAENIARAIEAMKGPDHD